MKKSLKVIFTTIILTIAIVTPVFATEAQLSAETEMLNKKMAGFGNDISTLVTFDNNCGAADIASIHTLVDTGRADVVKSNLAEQENYINYLKACVGNAVEIERVKKGNVAALTDLCKVNPTYQAQLDAAVAEYNKAVLDRVAAEQTVLDTQAYFKVLNASYEVNSLKKAAGDSQAIIQ